MTSDRTILITGVTGNQGGAVAQAMTRRRCAVHWPAREASSAC